MSRAETRSAVGTGAFVGAACAVCCAPPLIAALGLTLGLAAVAGVVAGIAAAVAVVIIGAGLITARRRTRRSCAVAATPVPVAGPTRRPPTSG
jgi:hypothetical protein